MQKALLFMPDISGFTEFIKATEINHSKHIIKELMELLLDKVEIGLELAEIEGDALFFYKIDESIDGEKVLQQVKSMFQTFHEHLQLYKFRRVCNCGACTNAEGLKLKFIIHEALIDFIEIKSTRKPFGEEVIKTHRLLKNNVPVSEYILVTSSFLDPRSDVFSSLFEKPGIDQAETIDSAAVNYTYFELDFLRPTFKPNKQVPRPQLGRFLLSNEIQIDAAPNDVFQFILDFEKRHLWSAGVDEIKFDPGEINQIGSKHTCVIGSTHLELSTIYKDEDQDNLLFIETTESAPIVKNLSSLFKVRPKDSGTSLEVDVFTKSTSFLGKLLSPILKSKLGAAQLKSMALLKKELEKGNKTNSA